MNHDFCELLTWFGLTEKEREAYAIILENGPMTIQEIVENSDISRRHVYNIVANLEDRNFVVKNTYITPSTVEPTPPGEVRKHLREKTDNLYRHLDERYRVGHNIIDEVKVLKSRSVIIDKIEEMVSAADDRIAISIPIDLFASLRTHLKDAVQRGLSVLVLLFEYDSSPQSIPDLEAEGTANVVRYTHLQIPILIAIDRMSALVAPPHAAVHSYANQNAIFLGQPFLEPIVYTSLMNTQWMVSEEVYTSSPFDLPYTYSDFPRAVIDATLHDLAGEGLVAEIEVKPRENDDTRATIRGDVADIKQRFIEPTTSPPPGQTSLTIDTGDELVTVGGKDSHMEDYRAYSTTLKFVA